MTFFGRLVGLGFPRRTVVSLASVLVLATLVGTAEAVTRGRIADRIATAAAKRLGTRPAVGLGATPVLWQLARGAFADVELTADDVAARHLTGLRVDARLSQVRRSRKGGTVGSSTVTVDIGSASLVAGASAGPAESVVVPDPAHGRLVVHIGRAGALAVPVTPVLDGLTIRVTPGRPTFAGRPLPDALARKVTARAGRTVPLSDLPLGLAPRRLQVTDDGLRLTLSGGRAAFDA
ncbi:hypothetical protein HEP81_01656 [Streptomyces griseofuscus]|uniref:DUF2993 domain-containing protein n=1 Tax=Streptomyces griseofuscus TaxID=146922 RepID=A0A7H1PVA5_9ACTN|nr:DUF2993 domain-containing protein [Streptomyces griseofuscus]QNT91985.1 hypothetical protein HEP81_01656 [Streptomyces griseofuscus]